MAGYTGRQIYHKGQMPDYTGLYTLIHDNAWEPWPCSVVMVEEAPRPIIQFAEPAYQVEEGLDVYAVVERTGSCCGRVRVEYKTRDETATAGSDYRAASGVLDMFCGRPRYIRVDTERDDEVEGGETFSIILFNPSQGADIGPNNIAQVTIADLPDLMVEPFELDPSAVVERDGRFTLPAEVTIRNIGGGDPPENIQVIFQGSGGFQEVQTIPSLPAGESVTLNVLLDLTDRILARKGDAYYKLTVEIPRQTREISRANNKYKDWVHILARPRIIEIKPEYTLSPPGYFLTNISVPNRVRVMVDWNGKVSGTGGLPYGEVIFRSKGTEISEPGQSWGAEHTFDMGSDFAPSERPYLRNCINFYVKRTIEGVTFPSADYWKRVCFQVVRFPGWVEWLNELGLNVGSFEAEPKPPVVEYTYGFTYPEEPFEAIWNVPKWVPYLGGEKLGITETQANVETKAQSSGEGSVTLTGQTGLELAGVPVQGEVYGTGDMKFRGTELYLSGAQLGMKIEATIEKQMGIADLFPGLRAAEGWWLLGRFIRWINNVATVTGSLKPGVDIQTTFKTRGDRLRFVHGEGTGGIEAKAELAVEPVTDLSASVYGGGRPYITIQVPKDPSYLKEVGVDLFYGLTLQAWSYETDFERKVRCKYPGGCEEPEEDLMALAATAPTWRLIPRDYAGPDYAAFVAGPSIRASSRHHHRDVAGEQRLPPLRTGPGRQRWPPPPGLHPRRHRQTPRPRHRGARPHLGWRRLE